MTATITPVSQHDSATLTRAVAGERMMMDGGASPLATILQKLADRTDFARDAVAFGRPEGAGSFSVDAGGTNASFVVRIGAFSRVVTYRSGTTTYKTFAYAGGTIGASKISGGGNLANSDWYFCYAYDNAGTLDFELSTTEPNANLCIKTGDSTRIYVGCFPTLSTGAPVPLRASRGRYVYRTSGCADADLKVLASGTQTANTAVDCAAFVPAHSRLATIRASVTNTAAAINYAYVRTEGDSGADEIAISLTNVNASTANAVFDIETDADQDIAYRVTANSGAPGLTLWVAGFYE
jgi:hypothetical protein